ncbi:MAG: 50S ribosomal protein L21, partial [bacterium]
TDVLLLAADGKIEIGKPVVAGAKVTAEIVRHARGKKIRVYKYKKKKGYQRTVGHRSEFTFVKVKSIARG